MRNPRRPYEAPPPPPHGSQPPPRRTKRAAVSLSPPPTEGGKVRPRLTTATRPEPPSSGGSRFVPEALRRRRRRSRYCCRRLGADGARCAPGTCKWGGARPAQPSPAPLERASPYTSASRRRRREGVSCATPPSLTQLPGLTGARSRRPPPQPHWADSVLSPAPGGRLARVCLTSPGFIGFRPSSWAGPRSNLDSHWPKGAVCVCGWGGEPSAFRRPA